MDTTLQEYCYTAHKAQYQYCYVFSHVLPFVGEDLSPEEYFVADKCPRFQQHYVLITSEGAQVSEVTAEKTITETTSDSEHTILDTPELYANPALGCAQASSTPDPRGQG